MMQWLYRFVASQLITISALSLSVMPAAKVSADWAYPYDNGEYITDDNCCAPAPCKSWWGENAMVILGSALLGAAAGAATGAAVSNRGHHSGDSSSSVPSCDCFARDLGNTLTFNFILNLSIAIDVATYTPFVSFPDGTVILGNSVVPGTGATVINFDSIVVDDPLFGTYTVGVQISDTGVLAVNANPILSATESRDDGSTTLFLDVTTALAVGGFDAQVSGDFTYGPIPVP